MKDKINIIAVEHFITSMVTSGMTKTQSYQNLALDKRLYKWNAITVETIKKAIEIFFKKD